MLLMLLFSLKAQNAKDSLKVYISTSSMAKAYHKSKTCFSLKNDQDELKYITLDDAKKMGRTSCKNCFPPKGNTKSGLVWVCTGGSSKKYHSTKECNGMKSCKGEQKMMKETEAKKAGRSACKMCLLN